MRGDGSRAMREPPEKLTFDPERCTGCLCCALACSLRHTGRFNPERAFIQVTGIPGHPAVEFADGCKECLRCAAWCPYGALLRAGKKG